MRKNYEPRRPYREFLAAIREELDAAAAPDIRFHESWLRKNVLGEEFLIEVPLGPEMVVPLRVGNHPDLLLDDQAWRNEARSFAKAIINLANGKSELLSHAERIRAATRDVVLAAMDAGLNVRLAGTVVLSVGGGRVMLKGKAARICTMKRVKRKNGRRALRRVCTKRPKPILPRGVETRKARGYTIFIGERLYFYLPAGTWRISAKGRGLSLSAVGEGIAGVKAASRRDSGAAEPGLISVGGELYSTWPRRWTRYGFGPDAIAEERGDNRDAGLSRPEERSSSATIASTSSTSNVEPATDSNMSDSDVATELGAEASNGLVSGAAEHGEFYQFDDSAVD